MAQSTLDRIGSGGALNGKSPLELSAVAARLEAEVLALRHQVNILNRTAPKRVRFTGFDRLLFVWLYRLWPEYLGSVTIVRPETVVRWYRQGFRAFWRWNRRLTQGISFVSVYAPSGGLMELRILGAAR